MKTRKIVAHAQHQSVLVPFDYVDIDIVVTERSELSRLTNVMQLWQKLKQFSVVILIEIHTDSSLIAIREQIGRAHV